MQKSDFDYELPNSAIARFPKENRTQSNLILVNRNNKSIKHKKFYEIIDFLNPGDLLILNNTKVIPAKILGKSKTRKKIDVLLVQRIDELTWEVLLKNPKEGLIIEFESGIVGKLLRNTDKIWIIKFNNCIDDKIWEIGNMPLPPYIDRESKDSDKITYQTVYAEYEGAIAAPTAGLHFDNELLENIRLKGINILYLTLHVGIGTFRPVKGKIDDHKMHSEFMNISDDVCKSINKAKVDGRRVIAVGTTVVRAIESADVIDNKILPTCGHTNLFIKPPYIFKFIDAIITNFHMPKSTLLMLVSAFAGRELIISAYKEAIKKGYRFLSYGDSMFIY